MTTNFIRIDSFVQEQENRLNQIKSFVNDRKATLQLQSSNIDNFLREVNAFGLEIGNMYSSHNGEEQYTDVASMIAHGTFETRKEYKNAEKLAEKLTTAWENNVADCIRARFFPFEINGTKVKFQLWIKSTSK